MYQELDSSSQLQLTGTGHIAVIMHCSTTTTQDSSCTESSASSAELRVAERRTQLVQLSGKANSSERNRINCDLQQLEGGAQRQQQQELPQMRMTRSETMRQQQLAAHWIVIHGERAASSELIALCVRCGDGAATTCRFHPDAKAFAFGTGRFDYAYTSAWDTPHDYWFCCSKPHSTQIGCCEEPYHTVDPNWWKKYLQQAPPLEPDDLSACDEGEESSEESQSGDADSDDCVTTHFAAMEID